MAEQIYEKTNEKKCPRCGCDKIKVSVYHFGATHKPT